MKEEVKPTRNQTIDLLKGLAIFLMLWGHAIQICTRDGMSFYDNFIYKFIYSFHMPLFMLLGGFLFFNTVNKYSFKEVFVKKIMGLLIPLIIWTIIYFVVKTSYNFYLGNTYNIFHMFLSDLNLFWFFWAILFCTICVLINSNLFKDNIFVYLVIFLIMFLVPKIDTFTFMYPFFLAGYFAKKIDFSKFKAKNFVITISIVIYLVMLIFYNKNYFIFTTGTYLLNGNFLNQVVFNLYRYVAGFAGCISIIFLFNLMYKKFENNFIFKYLIDAGKNSFAIYVLSMILLNGILPFLFPKIFTENIYLFSLVYTFIASIVYLVCLNILGKIIARTKIGKFSFGGR